MRREFLICGLIVTGIASFWVITECGNSDRASPRVGSGLGYIRSGSDSRSREGMACGLMPLQDALDITEEPVSALFESSPRDPLADTKEVVQGDLFLNCSVNVSKDGQPLRKAFLVLASAQKKQKYGYLVDFDEQFEMGERFAGLGERSSRFIGPGYSGRVSEGHGGYLMHYCPGGGRFVVAVGQPTDRPLGSVEQWKGALVHVNDEIMRLGGCAEPDRLAANPSLTAKPLPSMSASEK